MSKTTKICVMITGLLLAVGVLSALCLYTRTTSSSIADIYQNNELIRSIDLSKITDTEFFTIETADGGYNHIEIRSHAIGIIKASCPDKICIHTGFISNSLMPITCLPNHLLIMIRPSDDSSADSLPDALAY